MNSPLLTGNAAAFWGDDPDALARLVRQKPDLDFLTLDYLAEVSLSFMAIQREKDPRCGYARDFIDVVRSLASSWENGSRVKIVTNAGGLNPLACGRTCLAVLKELGLGRLRVAVISGDDVLPFIKRSASKEFDNLETGEPIRSIQDRLTTANAYLGSEPVANALRRGADIVITGRVADPSLTAGACIAHFDWAANDYDRIAIRLCALNFVLDGVLGEGGSRSLRIDAQGKTLGQAILEMQLPEN